MNTELRLERLIVDSVKLIQILRFSGLNLFCSFVIRLFCSFKMKREAAGTKRRVTRGVTARGKQAQYLAAVPRACVPLLYPWARQGWQSMREGKCCHRCFCCYRHPRSHPSQSLHERQPVPA
jgi:hypothetical protein